MHGEFGCHLKKSIICKHGITLVHNLIFTSTRYVSSYFLRKLIVINACMTWQRYTQCKVRPSKTVIDAL